MKQSYLVISIFLIMFVLTYNHNVFSQTMNPADFFDSNTGLPIGITEQISVTQIPQIPKPGEAVSVEIESYSTDFNKAQIKWTLNDKVISSGFGIKKITFNAPASGKTSVLKITITKEGGGVIQKNITINPADVDLMYEAQTYAPPFYKGKKLFTSESNISFIAVPNFVLSSGKKIPDEQLVYTWSVNGSIIESVSGYGRNIFVTKGTLIERPMTVQVDVSASNSTLKATQKINLVSTKPEFILYENNPLLGVVYEKAIQGIFNLQRPQIDFEGVPFFFDAQYKDSTNLKYTWSINGVSIKTKSSNENYLILQNDKNQEGQAVISTSIQHTKNILQNTASKIQLQFKKNDNSTNETFTF